MEHQKIHNIAFIDGQNLYRGLDWDLDYARFRVYLRDKYHIEEAYYFIGYKWTEDTLYENLTEAGFIVIFNEKGDMLKSNKKWNIDVTLVFYAMKYYFDQKYDQALIVSGDGDFKILVDFLIERGKFAKVLAPNIKYCSSLYNKTTHLPNKYVAYISLLKDKLEYKRKKGLPKH